MKLPTDPVDVDAALAGTDAVAARRDRVQSPGRHREHEVHDQHEAERPVERVVVAHAEDLRRTGLVGVVCCEPSEISSDMPLRTLNIPRS